MSGFDPAVTGGYVYGDFPNIVGGPEVHGSGEIWGQTLWDLRTALGHNVADTLITRGDVALGRRPVFLDMRNAILRADLVGYGGKHRRHHLEGLRPPRHGLLRRFDRLGATPSPASDFHVPPPPGTPHDGVVAGTVTDPVTG